MAEQRILAVTMVRNECDIVEAFVRHHLAVVDRIHILLHASTDATGAILDRLVAEGLPIAVERDDSVALNKEAQFNAMIGRAIARHDPDFIVPLDADEFVVPADRGRLAQELSALPPGGALWLQWQTYLPTAADDGAEANPVLRIRSRRRAEPARMVKACFPRASYRAPEVVLVDGQHQLSHRDGVPIPHVTARGLRLAHFPVRSAEQFVAKVVLGWLSRQLSPDRTEQTSAEWRRCFETLRPDFTLAPDALPAVAQAYYRAAPGDLVVDPLATPARLRHADLIKVVPVARVVAMAEALVARLGRSDGAPARDIDRAQADALLAERAELRAELRQRRREGAEIDHLRARLARARRRVAILAVAAAALAALAAGALMF